MDPCPLEGLDDQPYRVHYRSLDIAGWVLLGSCISLVIILAGTTWHYRQGLQILFFSYCNDQIWSKIVMLWYGMGNKFCVGFGFLDKNGIMKIGKMIVVGFLKLSLGSVL